MNSPEDNLVSTNEVTTHAPVIASPPTSARTTIHWADPGHAVRPELEREFEAMLARNWITEKMVLQYQKHWHCSREAALERLLSKTRN